MAQGEVPVWQRRWFGHLVVVLMVLAIAALVMPPVVALIYALRSVLLPVLIGVALAYAVTPLARWAERRLRVPRPVSAVLLMVAVAGVVSAVLLYLAPKLAVQLQQLVGNLPRYLDELTQELGVEWHDLIARLEELVRARLGAATQASDAGASTVDLDALGQVLLNSLGIGVGLITGTVGITTYLLLAAVIIAFVFFFFVWKFDRIAGWFVPFIPVEHRPRTLEIVRKMDATVSGFIRGRLIQASVVGVVLSVGWWWAGVPYALLLGVSGGVLNLIPYAAVVSWPVAIGLAWLDALSGGGFNVWGVLVWPSVVYIVAQGLDGWVVEPLVQGKATNLDPLTVLLVVLIGGSLAGLLGLLIAIPLAACVKILAQEVLLPKLRRWAAS
ncbi:MAG TPA: AI-2E family transporter [Phycisphaeraceae bacterium]